MVGTISKTVMVEQIKNMHMCDLCKHLYEKEEDAVECERKDTIAIDKRRKQKAIEEAKREKIIHKLLDKMPVIPEEEYAKLAIEAMFQYSGKIIPCLGCGHPYLEDYSCLNRECPGTPKEADDIDVADLFYDNGFELPYDFQIILYPEEKKP
jgi:hypothetical protein